MDLTDTHRAFHPEATEYLFFSSARGTFSRIELMLSHKTVFNKFKKIEIISSIFPNYNGMKLEIITRRKPEKTQTRGG